MIDKFNYSLANVQALPYTLTKLGAFDINSKIWPFIEYYSCTEEEKEAFRNKLKYEGKTVMALGVIGEYIDESNPYAYLKCQLVDCPDIQEDTHMVNEIYNELEKGVRW